MITLQKVSTSAYGAQFFQPATKGNGKKDPPPPLLAIGEKVELSEASITINRLREEIDAIPEVRIKLVEEIKEKIKQNDYPFTNNLHKIVDNWLEYTIV